MKRVTFVSEEQLVRAIVACARRAGRRDYRVELELDAGVGVADLVLTKRAPRSTAALHALGNISPRLAILLQRGFGDNVTCRKDLASVLGTSESGTQRVIAQLVAAGLAKQSGTSVQIATVKSPPYERLIAVEAKISNWQSVLSQAYRNLQFADESWVVLDHTFVRPALSQQARFEAAGVGLASIARGRGLILHLAAAHHGPMSVAKRWQAQAALASRAVARTAI